MIFVAILQAFGFAALASAMHATPAMLRLDRRRTALGRACGVLLLTLSAITALRIAPAGVAIAAWFGLATVAATAILLVLTVARQRTHK